jgi:hypothetical protein
MKREEGEEKLTLGSNGAVESVTLDGDGLSSRLSVSLEDVNGLDGILDVTSRVGRFDGEHGIDSERSPEVIVPVDQLQSTRAGVSFLFLLATTSFRGGLGRTKR